jgi:hypothetical protein
MNDIELNRIKFNVNNFEENFLSTPYTKKRRNSEIDTLEAEFQRDFENTQEYLSFKKSDRAVKKAGKGIGKAAKKIGETIKKAAKKLNPEDALYLPLIPMKGVMRKILDKKKISYGNGSIKNIVIAFHKGIVKKGKNFEEDENLVSDIVSIVQQIIAFFKKNKDAVDAGEASAEEVQIAAEVDNASANADDIDEEKMLAEFEMSNKKMEVLDNEELTNKTRSDRGSMGLNTNTIIILIAVVAGIYFVSKK